VSIYFLDSSALVKRYVQEIGAAWVSALCDPQHNHTLLIAHITLVEVAAAFASKRRAGAITHEEHGQVLQDFVRDTASFYRILAVDQRVITLGVALAGRQKLRAYDAVPLAVALTAHRILIAQQLPPLIFVTADQDLLTAARYEGLAIENPHTHAETTEAS
jgi:predicted nucleic acid-binding protein